MRVALPLTLLLAATPAAAERTFALVIGIDSYQSIPPLAGAVNDARDIANALTVMGAETTVLLDGAATRDAIVMTWTDLAAQLGPDDRMIVTYAGHGSNEPEAIAGEEADGRDENWLLAGFAPFGDASGERIRDNEIAALIALANPGQVILISDSCHAGTVSREINPPLGYRYYRTDGTLVDDPLPPPPPPRVGGEMDGLALFMGAVPEDEQVPEFLIDGAARGALSWAFAAGLRGAADTDANGVVSAAELEIFVREEVRAISRGLQRPQIDGSDGLTFALTPVAEVTVTDDSETDVSEAGESEADEIYAEEPEADEPPPEPEPVVPDLSLAFADLPGVTLSGVGTAPLPIGATAAEGTADLTLDAATGTMTTMVGDLFAEVGANPAALQQAVDNARLAAALMALDSGGMAVGFAEGDSTYRAGDRVTVQVAGRTTDRLALFSVAPGGGIVPLYPLNAPDLGVTDPATLPVEDALNLTLVVAAPFGSDFLVAVETDDLPAALAAMLADPTGTWTAQELWRALQAARLPRIAVFPFHSRGS